MYVIELQPTAQYLSLVVQRKNSLQNDILEQMLHSVQHDKITHYDSINFSTFQPSNPLLQAIPVRFV